MAKCEERPFDLDSGEADQEPDEGGQFRDPQPLAVGPGFDLDMNASPGFKTDRRPGQSLGRIPVVHREPKSVLDRLLVSSGGNRAENQDGSLDFGRPQGQSFFSRMNPEPIGARGQGQAADFDDPVAIGVRFDHGQEKTLGTGQGPESPDV